MPAALARSARIRPTLAAASTLLRLFRPSLTSAWRVLAAAMTLSPSAVNSWAYRCWPVRSTDRRGTPSLRMCARVERARRRRAPFLMLMCFDLVEAEGWSGPLPWSAAAVAGFRGKTRVRLRLLGFLAADDFVGIRHALALARLRRAEGADLGRHFTDALLVGALHQDVGLGRGRQGDAFRRLEHHRVREAQGQAQVLALHGGTVTHADQLQLALEALRHTLEHVGQDRADGTGEGDQRRVVGGQDGAAVLDGDLHAG